MVSCPMNRSMKLRRNFCRRQGPTTGRDDWQSPSLSGRYHARRTPGSSPGSRTQLTAKRTSSFIELFMGQDTKNPRELALAILDPRRPAASLRRRPAERAPGSGGPAGRRRRAVDPRGLRHPALARPHRLGAGRPAAQTPEGPGPPGPEPASAGGLRAALPGPGPRLRHRQRTGGAGQETRRTGQGPAGERGAPPDLTPGAGRMDTGRVRQERRRGRPGFAPVMARRNVAGAVRRGGEPASHGSQQRGGGAGPARQPAEDRPGRAGAAPVLPRHRRPARRLVAAGGSSARVRVSPPTSRSSGKACARFRERPPRWWASSPVPSPACGCWTCAPLRAERPPTWRS